MKFFKTFSVLFFAGVLQSCATSNKEIEISKENVISSSNGVLMASVTKGMKNNNRHTKVMFFISKEDGSKVATLLSHEITVLGAMLGEKNELEGSGNADGRINAFELIPGQYQLNSWSLFVPLGNGYKYIDSVNFKPYKFSIEPGKVTYLGDLHLETIYGAGFLGIETEIGAKSGCSDHIDRDKNQFIKKYPGLSAWPIKKSIANC